MPQGVLDCREVPIGAVRVAVLLAGRAEQLGELVCAVVAEVDETLSSFASERVNDEKSPFYMYG